MKPSAQVINWKGMSCAQLSCGSYIAWIAPEIGSNVIRLQETKKGIEFFRFREENTPEAIQQSPAVWGLPTLYLPNRFADGVLKTTDAVYHLPVNEAAPYNNHIHGFLHERKHQLVALEADATAAWVKTSYLYDEADPFFAYLPISFRADFTFRLTEEGLFYTVTFTNLSENKQMPISLATHTAMNSPFVVGGDEADSRIQVPITEKWVLNERCLPTCEILPLNDYDLQYKNGTMCPVLQNIDNDMYTATTQAYQGKPFHGILMRNAEGKGIGYEVSENYRFWILWNDKGFNGYFCPEPMTAMIDAPNLPLPYEQTGYQEIAPNEQFTATQHFFAL
jgi:aldose 1-epimerase